MSQQHSTVRPDQEQPRLITRHMQAYVAGKPGGADATRLSTVPVPQPRPDQLLVKVDATTVISSELASLDGVSMAKLPLVLGNDFIGTVAESPGGAVPVGTRVAGGYGGYGYVRDGAWAEYICVDVDDALPIVSGLDSVQLAAIPGSFTAASGSLNALGPVDGRTLLIRGGTSGVGLAITTLALDAGALVVSTTRNPDKRDRLLSHGAQHVVIDGPDLVHQVRDLTAGGADLAVDLLGVASLPTTLRAVRPYGVVCLTGLLADQTVSRRSGVREDRSLNVFPHPMEFIPPTVRLTVGGVDGSPRTAALMQTWVAGLEAGRFRMPVDSVFTFDQMIRAQERRGAPDAFGKVVIDMSST